MTLPEIPTEAITEAGFEMGHCEPYAEAALRAAWPALYAAALRDVGERMDREFGQESNGWFARELADEAGSPQENPCSAASSGT